MARAKTSAGTDAISVLEQARAEFQRFMDKAGDEPRYAGDVVNAREHLADLRDAMPFVHGASR